MDKKKKIQIGVIVVTALIAINVLVKAIRKNMQAVDVKVVKVEKGQISNDVIYSGMVTPDEVTPVYTKSLAIVEDIFVRVGEEVEVGDKLLSFSGQSILANENALKVNELDIQNIELQIQDQESGSMKLELDNKQLEIKNLEEQIKSDQRKLPVATEEARLARKKADTYMMLLAKDGVSSTEATTMTSSANRAEASLEDLRTTLSLNREKYQLMVSSYESLKRELDISRAQLQSQLEKLKLTNTALKEADKELKEPFVAPVAGVITRIDATIGGSISSGQRVISIATPGSNKVQLELPVYQVGSIKKGQPASIIVRDGEKETRYKGVVDKASSAAVSSSYGKNKVIAVEVLVIDKNELKPGFVVDVELSGKGKAEVPILSSFSVVRENDEYYVYVNDFGIAKKQKIKVGMKSANYYEVLDLPEGTEVIVNPFKVTDGDKIKVVEE